MILCFLRLISGKREDMVSYFREVLGNRFTKLGSETLRFLSRVFFNLKISKKFLISNIF